MMNKTNLQKALFVLCLGQLLVFCKKSTPAEVKSHGATTTSQTSSSNKSAVDTSQETSLNNPAVDECLDEIDLSSLQLVIREKVDGSKLRIDESTLIAEASTWNNTRGSRELSLVALPHPSFRGVPKTKDYFGFDEEKQEFLEADGENYLLPDKFETHFKVTDKKGAVICSGSGHNCVAPSYEDGLVITVPATIDETLFVQGRLCVDPDLAIVRGKQCGPWQPAKPKIIAAAKISHPELEKVNLALDALRAKLISLIKDRLEPAAKKYIASIGANSAGLSSQEQVIYSTAQRVIQQTPFLIDSAENLEASSEAINQITNEAVAQNEAEKKQRVSQGLYLTSSNCDDLLANTFDSSESTDTVSTLTDDVSLNTTTSDTDTSSQANTESETTSDSTTSTAQANSSLEPEYKQATNAISSLEKHFIFNIGSDDNPLNDQCMYFLQRHATEANISTGADEEADYELKRTKEACWSGRNDWDYDYDATQGKYISNYFKNTWDGTDVVADTVADERSTLIFREDNDNVNNRYDRLISLIPSEDRSGNVSYHIRSGAVTPPKDGEDTKYGFDKAKYSSDLQSFCLFHYKNDTSGQEHFEFVRCSTAFNNLDMNHYKLARFFKINAGDGASVISQYALKIVNAYGDSPGTLDDTNAQCLSFDTSGSDPTGQVAKLATCDSTSEQQVFRLADSGQTGVENLSDEETGQKKVSKAKIKKEVQKENDKKVFKWSLFSIAATVAVASTIGFYFAYQNSRAISNARSTLKRIAAIDGLDTAVKSNLDNAAKNLKSHKKGVFKSYTRTKMAAGAALILGAATVSVLAATGVISYLAANTGTAKQQFQQLIDYTDQEVTRIYEQSKKLMEQREKLEAAYIAERDAEEAQ